MKPEVVSLSGRTARTLRERILNAGWWTLAGHILRQGTRFGTNLIMTRLLVPEMFGVMAIANMVMIGLALLSDLGLRQNIVQSHRGNEPEYLNTAWVVQIARGFILGIISVLIGSTLALANHLGIAPPGSVYAEGVLPYVVAILGFSAVVSGFNSTKLSEASRRLELGKLTKIDIVSQLGGVALMLIFVLFERTVWVLVVGNIAASVIRMILTHTWLLGVRNRLHWDGTAFKEIFHFGKWIFLSSMLTFFGSASDMMILGGLVSAQLLGIYSIAILLFNSIEQIVMIIAGNIAFPALSEVARERRHDLGKTLYKFHLPLAAFTYGVAGLLSYLAPMIVGFLYDPRFSDAGWMLQILALALFAVPCRLHASCLLALGKPRQHAYLVAVRLLAILVAVPSGFYLGGIQGVVWGIVASYFISIPTTLFLTSQHGILHINRELLPLPFFAVGWFVAAAVSWGV